MSKVFADVRFLRGQEATIPTLEEGQPGFTKDTKRVFIGSNTGNVELAKKEDVDGLTDDVSVVNTKTNAWKDVITDFGAIGDGFNDDTAAIQNAFNYARDNGGVKLTFPKGGIFVTKSPIRMYKNTFVDMTGATILRMGGSGHNNIFTNGEPGNLTYATAYNGEGNIHFKGGTIDINTVNSPLASVTTKTSAFDLGHGENISFREVTIQNGQNGHYFQVSSCKNVLFDKCKFLNVRYTDNTGSYDYECIQIEEMTDISFPSFGGYDSTISRDITIQNCIFDGVVRTIGTHSFPRSGDGITPARYCENIEITNNVFRNVLDDGIHLEAFRNVKIKDNVFDTIGKYGIHTYYCTNIKLDNNVGYNVQQSAIYMEYTDKSKTNKNYWKDTCLTTGFSAIRLSFSNNNVFNDDTVTSSATPTYQYAMYFSDCSGNIVRGFDFVKGYGTKDKGGIAGVGTQLASQFFGAKSQVLYDGDLAAIGSTYTFNDDLRAFSQIIVVGNNSTDASSNVVTMNIPSVALVFGSTTNRYRILTSPSASAYYLQFHFDTDVNNLHTITVDDLTGVSRIRKIIGIR